MFRAPTRRQLLNLAVVGAAAGTMDASAAEITPIPFQSPFQPPEPKARTVVDRGAEAPSPVVSLDNQSRYAPDDPSHSIVDPQREADYEASVTPLRRFSELTVKLANRYFASDGRKLRDAAAAAGGLWQWARAGALDDVKSTPALLNRSTTMSALGLSLLQIRTAFSPDDKQMELIRDWMRLSGASTVEAYSRGDLNRATAQNNHRYWAGLASAVCGLVGTDQVLVEWGLEGALIAGAQIDANGALPLELARGARALDYHAYALGPLIMLAEIGERNGRSIYAAQEGALHRLVDFTLAGFDDPQIVERIVGAPQESMGREGANFDPHQVAWLEIYEARFPGRSRWSDRLDKLRPLSATTLGGNLTLLAAPPPA